MAVTYSGDPASSDLDESRFLTGDTDITPITNAILQDEEHQFLIDEAGSVAYGVVRAATSMAAKFARKFDSRTGAVSKSLGQVMQHFLDLAKRLQQRADEGAAGVQVGAPIFTALTRTDKLEDRQDPDLVRPQFRIDQDDNPRRRAGRDDATELINPNP